jgi:glycosyltransferase involved in cell wall biosynthesis
MIRVLFQSWLQVQHSYGIVMAFILIHLQKNYNDKIKIYIQEEKYFNPKWENSKKGIYNKEYTDILSKLQVYNGEPIDLIWRQTFPYNISVEPINIPKCVFYTSEFGKLDASYFNIDNVKLYDDEYIKEYLKIHTNIHFTTPSVWSSIGLKPFSDNDQIITHGVDTNIFYRNFSLRDKIRSKYNIQSNEILMINVGAMTGNKGILLILEALHLLINKLGKTEYKLLLKGSSDLYTSQQFLESYLSQLNTIITKEESNKLEKHIIFIQGTVQFNTLNDLYNCADIYVSPYLCEGFNLTVLEALSAGLPVLVPRTGSTREFINDIYNNSGEQFIHYVDSEIIIVDGNMQNKIRVQDLVGTMINFNKDKLDNTKMSEFINEKYSWNIVSHLVFNYINKLIKK